VLLTLVVPCFNEADSLLKFHLTASRALTHIPDVAHEIIYVDDGSTDRTIENLRQLAALDDKVRYLSLSRNFGKEAAMLAGMRHSSGDAVIIMDADLQHPPELIGRMLELNRKGFDQEIARRTRQGDRFARTVLARAYYWLINKWVDVELMDGAGDFRLLSRPAVDALLAIPENNRFSKGLFAWIGFESIVFEYENVARENGGGKWSVGKLINYGLDGLISFNNKPLRSAIYIGLVLFAFAFAYAAWVAGVSLVKGVDLPGYATVIVAVIALGGLQFLLLGVVGEYVGRIYYETKRRPHYLLKETDKTSPQIAPTGMAAQESVPPLPQATHRS